MDTRTVGASDLVVSVAGLGCNNFGMRTDEARTAEIVGAALDAGITLFDTARMYGGGKSEEFLGAALRAERDQVVIATKFGAPTGPDARNGSRATVMAEAEASLTALGTDYIDLYQMHYADPGTPIEETLGALTELVEQGKVRYIGCSNFAGWQIADAHWIAATKDLTSFVSLQNEWSLLARGIETEVLGACERFGLGVLPYFPLASGVLTGKVRRGEEPPEGSRLNLPYFAAYLTDANHAKLDRLDEWCRGHDRTMHDVALSYLASNPVTASVIAGASSPEQVRANAAATRTDLTAEARAEIVAAVDG
ncbi:MAG: aldo/keto reductase [Acidimicrobiia bacterium]|jgi:aryl-alcohol dehydrogenase-like predicted oxidoreductase